MIKRARHGATSLVKPARQRWWNLFRIGVRWLGAAAVIAVLGGGLYWAGHRLLEPGLLPLQHVYLEGRRQYLAETDSRELVQDYLGQNFLTLDIGALHDRFADNPWVEQVTVQRQWPDSLKVRMRERIPFGRWGEDEMVDVNGQRFRPAVVPEPDSWPWLIGPEGHEQQLIRAYQESSAMLGKIGLRLLQLAQDERRAWRLIFADGLEVRLGRDQFSQRLQRFIDIYPHVLAHQIERIAVVDLRYTNGFAVLWKTGTTALTG